MKRTRCRTGESPPVEDRGRLELHQNAEEQSTTPPVASRKQGEAKRRRTRGSRTHLIHAQRAGARGGTARESRHQAVRTVPPEVSRPRLDVVLVTACRARTAPCPRCRRTAAASALVRVTLQPTSTVPSARTSSTHSARRPAPARPRRPAACASVVGDDPTGGGDAGTASASPALARGGEAEDGGGGQSVLTSLEAAGVSHRHLVVRAGIGARCSGRGSGRAAQTSASGGGTATAR